jgi:PAS domain S-box-containing protein
MIFMTAPHQRHTLRKRIFFSFLAALLPVVVFCVVAIEIFLVPAISANARQELHNATLMLKSAVQTAADVAVRNHLKAIAEKNAEIVNHLLGRVAAGEFSLEQAKMRAREILLAQRIGSSGYIYCIDSQGMAVVHPNPGVESTDNTRFAFVREQMARKQGYIEYEWQNPGEERAMPKALYMTYVAGLDWIISVSSYRAEFKELIDIGDFRDLVLSPRFGASGYAYVVNQQGDTLIHPVLSDFNALRQSEQSSAFLRTMLDSGSGTIEYRWRNPNESAISEKIAVYESIAEYGWLIVSSSYKSEIFAPAATLRKVAYGATVLLCLAAALASYLLSGRVTRPVAAMIAQLDRNARQLRHDPLPVQGEDELGRLAGEFNTFLATIEASNNELQRQKDRYLTLFETSPDAVIVLRDHTLIDCNQAALISFVGTKEELVGKSVLDLSPELQPGGRSSLELAAELIGAGKPGQLQTFAWLHRDLHGRCFDAEVQLKGFGYHDGDVLLVAFIRDITEQRQLEEVARHAQKMEAIGTLAGGIAHDFNNILMGIQGRAELLALTGVVDLGAREHLRAIEDAVTSASGLTRQLLGFARGGKYQPRPLDLNDLLRSSIELFGRTRKGLEIRVECLATPVVSEVDGPQIEQVLLNLCVNAGQAMPDGGILRLSTGVVDLSEDFCRRYKRPAGRYGVISVADSGIGMDEATQQRVFDPFFSTKGPGRGSGLGLASVYGIVDNHQGIITVTSRPGAGATFTIYLPLSLDAPTALAPHDGEVRKGRETVLLIDDEEMILEVGAAMLHALGYRVLTAGSGELALQCLEERGGEIDLVVLDLIMPGMDGAAVFSEIRQRLPLLPVVLSSGYALDDVAKEILATGCGAFIQKPFSLAVLSRQLRQVLEQQNRNGEG